LAVAPDEWFADEAFWEASYPAMFPESRFRAAEEEIEALLELAHRPVGPILDLACGPGRHSIPLAQRGFAVTGVDRSPFLLQKAQERGREAKVEVEWLQADMRDFLRPATYGLALSLFTSFGYFRPNEENERVLENIHTSLAPGGAFILDVAGKEVLARIYQATGSGDVPGGIIVQRRTVVEDWSQMANEWILIEEDRVRSFSIRHWIYSGRELKQMLQNAGFATVQLFGDLRGAPYGPAAARLVACVWKAPA
jgi:SAM-dependent methyltransferase